MLKNKLLLNALFLLLSMFTQAASMEEQIVRNIQKKLTKAPMKTLYFWVSPDVAQTILPILQEQLSGYKVSLRPDIGSFTCGSDLNDIIALTPGFRLAQAMGCCCCMLCYPCQLLTCNFCNYCCTKGDNHFDYYIADWFCGSQSGAAATYCLYDTATCGKTFIRIKPNSHPPAELMDEEEKQDNTAA